MKVITKAEALDILKEAYAENEDRMTLASFIVDNFISNLELEQIQSEVSAYTGKDFKLIEKGKKETLEVLYKTPEAKDEFGS